MPLLEKYLVVKASTIPGAGKGLFTKKMIPKGTRIIEYTGKISTWKEADHQDGLNPYIYYVNKNHVIDSSADKKILARYVNDAKGFKKIDKLKNNCKFVEDGLRVYIESTKDIQAQTEIFVGYGKKYWDVIAVNVKAAGPRKK